VTPWFTDLRKVALLTCITGVLGTVLPVWSGTQSILALTSTRPLSTWWIVPLLVLTYAFTAILPVFYFAVYRNYGTLRFPRRLRLLALAAACTFSIYVAVTVARWIESLGPYWSAMTTLDWRIGAASVLAAARAPGTINFVSSVLGTFSNLAYILMLIAVFRHASDPSELDLPISKPLIIVTKVAAITWGLVAAFNVVRIILIPYSYAGLRDYALQIGRRPPRVWDFAAELVPALVITACMFAGPYIVYKSLRDKRVGGIAEPDDVAHDNPAGY